jgi:branched-chain amino acid transport system permease protein
MRFVAFLVASFGTGLAGILYPPIVGFVSPNAFQLDLSVLFFFAVIVGGKGEPLGTLVGVTVLYLVPNVMLARMAEDRTLIYGIVAFIIMIAMPSGVVGSLMKWRRLRRPPPKIERVDFAAIRLTEPAGRIERGGAAIEIRGLCKSFGNVVALNAVDLTIRRGEIHGIVGANGSGKTSLLNVLSGFSVKQTGEVRISGRDISALSASRIASLGVGRTFQTPRIFDQLTAWENVQVGLDSQWNRLPRRIPAEFVRNLRASLEGRDSVSIPHGLRRLVEISRAILREPQILLLDEPAAGLSPDERIAFANLLRDLRDRLGLTIVFVEHDLDLVARVADRVTVLESGSVIASGDRETVWRDPRVRPLFLTTRHA